jgi:hypothetical protein
LHSTDDALGELRRSLPGDVILLVTADHAVLPHPDIAAVLRGVPDFDGSAYDRIPLFIVDPFHALPPRIERWSNGTDLAPTVLHLLGVDAPNAFAGRSVLEPDPRRPVTDAPMGLGPWGLFGSQANLGFVLDASQVPTQRWYPDPSAASTDDEPAAVRLYRRWFAWQRWVLASGRLAISASP